MTNPVMEALRSTRATERLQELGYEPPRSWTKEAKLRFLDMPADLQVYVVAREKERDRAVRNAQNEAGSLRREVAELKAKLKEADSVQPASTDPIKTHQPKKADDGIHEKPAA
jgi:hypothetical protein